MISFCLKEEFDYFNIVIYTADTSSRVNIH